MPGDKREAGQPHEPLPEPAQPLELPNDPEQHRHSRSGPGNAFRGARSNTQNVGSSSTEETLESSAPAFGLCFKERHLSPTLCSHIRPPQKLQELLPKPPGLTLPSPASHQRLHNDLQVTCDSLRDSKRRINILHHYINML